MVDHLAGSFTALEAQNPEIGGFYAVQKRCATEPFSPDAAQCNYPTNPFPILVPQNPPNGEFYAVRSWGSVDSEALELWKDWSGSDRQISKNDWIKVSRNKKKKKKKKNQSLGRMVVVC